MPVRPTLSAGCGGDWAKSEQIGRRMRNALGVVVLLLLVVVAVGGSAAFDLGSPVVWVAALALAGGGALALSGWLFARVPAHMRVSSETAAGRWTTCSARRRPSASGSRWSSTTTRSR